MKVGNNYSGARWTFSQRPPADQKIPRFAVRRFMPLHANGGGRWERLTNLYKLEGAARNAYHKLQKKDRTHKHIVMDEINKVQVWPPVASEDGEASRGA